jgi:flagellar basal body-associated protein FliL
MRIRTMTTILESGSDSGSSAVMVIMALVIVAVVGFAIYFFSNGSVAGPSSVTNTTISAPAAPSMPSPTPAQ